MSDLPLPTRFDAEDQRRAWETWGANCGPGAVAAIAGLSLDELRPYLGDFEAKGYTNPTLTWAILRGLGVGFMVASRGKQDFPAYGLARVQFTGPWTAPGVPPRVAYRHTHWVGALWSKAKREHGVFDINAIANGGTHAGWTDLDSWSASLVPWLLAETEPKADGGWHLTHRVEVDSATVGAPLRARLGLDP